MSYPSLLHADLDGAQARVAPQSAFQMLNGRVRREVRLKPDPTAD
jgi:hypothetical protein